MTGFEPQTSGIEATALLTEPQLLPILPYLNTNKKFKKNFDRSFFSTYNTRLVKMQNCLLLLGGGRLKCRNDFLDRTHFSKISLKWN